MQRDFYSNLLRPVTLIRGVYSDLLYLLDIRAFMRIFSRRFGVFLARSGRHLVDFCPETGEFRHGRAPASEINAWP